MTPPLLASAIFAAHVLFPGYSPLAVWIGLGSIAALGWVWWRADDALGDCEAGIRADEAAQWLRRMEIRRVA